MIGFIGLGNMGFPMAHRLAGAGRELIVYDTRDDVVERATRFGASGASSVREVADRAQIVLASLPSLPASAAVADEVAESATATLFIDLSTVGSELAQRNHDTLAARGIAALDAPVSGGVSGAQQGGLAIMVSGPPAAFDTAKPLLDELGRPFFVGEKPGAAQTMKLVNNLMAAATLAATAEVIVMGVKAGLDPQVMLDVLNAGSGGTHASRDKFPKAVLPRTFDYGFATGLMVKDVRLYLDEAAALGLPRPLADAVAGMWESTLREQGPESDFTSIVKVLENAAGVTVGAVRRSC
ncbi:NAD(P)-dependent oxidoreductase [Mycolicibacter terrae]|uniref:Oxidoreductase n=2 Tax=Mycolicibacter TaxID=1073531 RepID=A0A1A2XTU1_MYCSD|nr:MULTISPECIES: NAD(P)-dependent oxidoreductase [Mycolicibacter]OBH19009.1 oxidoreductase [Mycolicibacter sinensis]OBI29165.1 oxidoreductase [Mycolicibacter sinensis]RRR44379.1 NAD(P)-dependent oxidoreductase [Mycolicibacter terrae]